MQNTFKIAAIKHTAKTNEIKNKTNSAIPAGACRPKPYGKNGATISIGILFKIPQETLFANVLKYYIQYIFFVFHISYEIFPFSIIVFISG